MMPAGRRFACAAGVAVALLWATASGAAESKPATGALKVENAWARETPPGADVGAAYMLIRNPGRRSDRLLSAWTPRAARVEFHTMIRDVNMVRMQRIEPVHVAAQGDLALEPGALHAMLFGLRTPLRKGERFPMTLLFERAGRVPITVRVYETQAAPPKHAGH